MIIWERMKKDSGAAAIILAPILVLFTAFGFVTVDVGTWYSDRRDAQGDADAIALAAAQELPSFDNDAAAVAAAQAVALEWADANDIEPSELTVEVIDTCFSVADEVHTGVRVSVTRTAPSFFAAVFPGTADPVIGTVATACSGQPVTASGFMPWAIETAGDCFTNEADPQDRSPILGQRCDLSVGGAGGSTGDVGQLALAGDENDACEGGGGGAAQYADVIVTGSPIECTVGDSVTSNSGINVGKTIEGLENRFALEGLCSVNPLIDFAEVVQQTNAFNAHPVIVDLLPPGHGMDGGKVDDFFEIWRPGPGYDPADPAANLDTYDCDPATTERETSVRSAPVIIIADIGVDDGVGCFGSGVGANPHCYEVMGFARIYIEGCSTTMGGFDAKCGQNAVGSSFTVHARFVEAYGNSNGTLGLNRLGDTQTFLAD